MNPVAVERFSLKPTMEPWAFHIGCFIGAAPNGFAGRPVATSASRFGAMVKTLMKHATCRRRLTNQPISPGQERESWAAMEERIDSWLHMRVPVLAPACANRSSMARTTRYFCAPNCRRPNRPGEQRQVRVAHAAHADAVRSCRAPLSKAGSEAVTRGPGEASGCALERVWAMMLAY